MKTKEKELIMATKAFEELIEHWNELPIVFRNKHKSAISKFNNGKIVISYEKRRNMLLQAGYKEIYEAEFKSPFSK